MMHAVFRIFLFSILLFFSKTSFSYKADIGYTRLLAELGAALPTGAGVLVSQTEADTDGVSGSPYVYFPDVTDPRFAGKTINNQSNLNDAPSAHATSVGRYFYGTGSVAKGIGYVDVYEVNSWLQGDYLRVGSLLPRQVASRIANHSWVGSTGDLAKDLEILMRLDWVVETDEFIQIVGVKNNTGTNRNLLSGAYNVLAVGRTDGLHGTGTTQLSDAVYGAGRTRPEIVAPRGTTSAATPVVAAAAALLVETAQANPGLSSYSKTNRAGDTIKGAECSETIKAALLAGADRFTRNTSITANITDYRVDPANRTANGLDSRFGAGQLNIYNSYHIIAAGEQDSSEDGGGNIAAYGFDYDDAFGGLSASNSTASYYFSTYTAAAIVSASLVWNIKIDEDTGANFDGTATLHDLNLALYDVTGGGRVLLASSNSTIDNSENIWSSLPVGRNYLLEVTSVGNFSWHYALAWNIAPDRDADGISDVQDNCPDDANTSQTDLDGDGLGDACDSDIDGDGVLNIDDAFPYDPAETTDTDGDGIGNNADPDDDNDGLTDSFEISIGTNTLLTDSDGDGLTDYAEVAFDGDATNYTPGLDLDPLSVDTDQDGIADGSDPIPLTWNYADGDIGPLGSPDGKLDQADLVVMEQIMTGRIPVGVNELSHADLYPPGAPDGVIDLSDLVLLRRRVLP